MKSDSTLPIIGVPPQTTAHDHAIALQAVTFDDLQADVMRFDHGPVIGAAGDGNLEFARQELEFRVVGGPLPDQFGHGAGIGDFIGGGTGEMVGGDVAYGVAAGLDGMHPDLAPGHPACPAHPTVWASCTGCSAGW